MNRTNKGGTVWIVMILGMVWLNMSLGAQGLFESAAGASEDNTLKYELNGYVRSSIYLGESTVDIPGEVKSGYGETSLKLKIRKQDLGDAYAEIRFRGGSEWGTRFSEFLLREAYVNAYLGPFDLRIGRQIVVWGRADGINPTNNITPENGLVRSPDEDDRRVGNFLVRSFLNMEPFRLELIWVPVYESSVIPTDFIPLPDNILLTPDFPEAMLKNGAVALKLDLVLPEVDGSLSYFEGYFVEPGLFVDVSKYVSFTDNLLAVSLKPHRTRIFGADFSTSPGGGIGLRGEIAYRRPCEDHRDHVYVPNPEWYVVLGIDRQFSDHLYVIVQYVGRFVQHFTELAVPEAPEADLAYQLEYQNRLLYNQLYKTSHSLVGSLELKLMHENLSIELGGMANLTSDEFLAGAKVSYNIADSFTVCLGCEWYGGPEGSLYGIVADYFNALFTEVKISF